MKEIAVVYESKVLIHRLVLTVAHLSKFYPLSDVNPILFTFQPIVFG